MRQVWKLSEQRVHELCGPGTEHNNIVSMMHTHTHRRVAMHKLPLAIGVYLHVVVNSKVTEDRALGLNSKAGRPV